LKAGRTTVTVERDGTTIVVRNVPAEVCETCAEDYLDAAVASSLETVLQEASRSGVQFEVREYKAA
jgi:YgiT-type zinc finger domain-containing protein